MSKNKRFVSIINDYYEVTTVSLSYLHQKNLLPYEIFDKHIADIWGDDVFEKEIKPYIDKALDGEECENEGWFSFDGEEKRYYKTTYIPLLDEDNTIRYVAVITTDYTDEIENKNTEIKNNSNID